MDKSGLSGGDLPGANLENITLSEPKRQESSGAANLYVPALVFGGLLAFTEEKGLGIGSTAFGVVGLVVDNYGPFKSVAKKVLHNISEHSVYFSRLFW